MTPTPEYQFCKRLQLFLLYCTQQVCLFLKKTDPMLWKMCLFYEKLIFDDFIYRFLLCTILMNISLERNGKKRSKFNVINYAYCLSPFFIVYQRKNGEILCSLLWLLDFKYFNLRKRFATVRIALWESSKRILLFLSTSRNRRNFGNLKKAEQATTAKILP